MAKIHKLKISNYRGIRHFEQTFGTSNIICLIGRGDSGKSSILEAISIILSPNWNVAFYDTDFFALDIEKPIEIEASLYDVPSKLIQESKFGLYIRGLDRALNIISDDLKDHHETILTIKLKVENDLEPKWFVTNGRQSEDIEIRAHDRALLNTYFVSDYVDRHFSWNKGNPLYSLLRETDTSLENSNVILNAFRNARATIDPHAFEHLQTVLSKVKESAQSLGITINNLSSSIDYKDITIKDGRITLHEDRIPYRLKGKGSKRLLSIAIQVTVLEQGGILLIDEVEQGLEPDRVKHLVSLLKNTSHGQVFMTTHSRDVLVELQYDDIYLLQNKQATLVTFEESFQGCLRRNPEAFFSRRVIVCEGATEVGICRSINNHCMNVYHKNFPMLGIAIVDGTGTSFLKYCEKFKDAGFDVCALCDSDDPNINSKKPGLELRGIKVFDWDDGNAVEHQVIFDLPWNFIQTLVNYVIDEKGEISVKQLVENQHGPPLPDGWYSQDDLPIRTAIGKAAGYKKKTASGLEDKSWFKRIDHGAFLGDLLVEALPSIKDKRTGLQLHGLLKWIDNA